MARKAKSKLAKLMSEKHVRALYVPTPEEVKKWFRIINREVMGCRLRQFQDIEIRRRHGCWGECSGYTDEDGTRYSDLSLNHHVRSRRHLVSIIAHEMTHAITWQERGSMDHGDSFMYWKDKFRKFGVVLNIVQRT